MYYSIMKYNALYINTVQHITYDNVRGRGGLIHTKHTYTDNINNSNNATMHTTKHTCNTNATNDANDNNHTS